METLSLGCFATTPVKERVWFNLYFRLKRHLPGNYIIVNSEVINIL